jgi:ornithine cyclodeaminase/alanine dehydrogenase-like protein (mu-crystallin family)
VRREWLRAGAHVNSVGYNTAGREVDGETVAAALVVIESRAARSRLRRAARTICSGRSATD